MNYARVLLGGLVTGLILNIGEFVLNDFVLSAGLKEFMSAHNFSDPGGIFIVAAVGLTFVMGIVIVLGYAAIRPRFGPGPKTAVIAALLPWFGVSVYCGIVNGLFLGIPTATIMMVIGWGFVEYILAALVGAWLYKEV